MEQPYAGRAIIEDNFTEVRITIPAKRNWAAMLFLCFWLCGWLMGELAALGFVLGAFGPGPSLFVAVWLVFWTVGGLTALRALLWMARGREVITMGQGVLAIDKKGDPLAKQKEYDLKVATNFRVLDDSDLFPAQRRSLTGANTGTIRFDYGMRTIRFGQGLDEAEAGFIMQKLRDRGWVG